jgi:hypothetical protein
MRYETEKNNLKSLRQQLLRKVGNQSTSSVATAAGFSAAGGFRDFAPSSAGLLAAGLAFAPPEAASAAMSALAFSSN